MRKIFPTLIPFSLLLGQEGSEAARGSSGLLVPAGLFAEFRRGTFAESHSRKRSSPAARCAAAAAQLSESRRRQGHQGMRVCSVYGGVYVFVLCVFYLIMYVYVGACALGCMCIVMCVYASACSLQLLFLICFFALLPERVCMFMRVHVCDSCA